MEDQEPASYVEDEPQPPPEYELYLPNITAQDIPAADQTVEVLGNILSTMRLQKEKVFYIIFV